MATPDPALLVMIPVIGWLVFRRVQRQFGRQPFTPKRQIARLVFLVVAMAALLFLAVSVDGFALPIGACLAAGAAIGLVNLRLTRFEWSEGGDYYYPHPYIGAVLSLLLVGRLIYRFAVIGSMSVPGGQPPTIAQQGPLTFAFAGLLVGYYVAYIIGLLVVRARHHRSGP